MKLDGERKIVEESAPAPFLGYHHELYRHGGRQSAECLDAVSHSFVRHEIIADEKNSLDRTDRLTVAWRENGLVDPQRQVVRIFPCSFQQQSLHCSRC
jgi:hypothetical protein